MDGWSWRYDGYDPADEGLREALCTVGNGYLATRGAAPESAADDVHYPGTYLAGVYNRLSTEVSGNQVSDESLVNAPNWLPLTFRIDDGEWFDLAAVTIEAYQQVFDLRRAVLSRRVRFTDATGRTTTLAQQRWADMHRPHVCVLETTIVAENWSGRLTMRSAIDGTVSNSGVARYRQLPGEHLVPVATSQPASDSVLLAVATRQSHVRLAVAARTRVLRAGEPVDPPRRLVERDAWVGQDLELTVGVGDAVTIEKVVTVFTSRDRASSEPGEEAARWLTGLPDARTILVGHVKAWRHLWERFHVDTTAEVADLLPIVRLHLVHLLQTVSPNSIDLDVGVPARGLHGEAYRGHIFWDEIFVLPMLTLRLPALSRALLLYRYRRLPEAREAARGEGLAGALFPWQSGSDGREESPRWHLNPASGRWLPDPTRRQRHIGIAIAYNVWTYYETTGDQEFLVHHGAELLVEIARCLASLAHYDRALGRYVSRGVMGPDEFHSDYPDTPEEESGRGIDNNAYTNVMTVWTLLRAREALQALPDQNRAELLDDLDLRPEELDRWEDVSRKLVVPFHSDELGRPVISQFEGYADLKELDWAGYAARYPSLQRLDRILEAEGDDVNRYQVSKQADVLMLFYLLSAEELGELLAWLGYDPDPETIPRTIDYYLVRTSHGSTLSAVVHSWVLTRLHRERGMELFDRALRADVVDIQGGTTREGIHLAAMAGSVDLLQRCFAGIETRGGRLGLAPDWPEPLKALEFRLRYREHQLSLRITADRVTVHADAGPAEPVEVVCRGESALLHPAARVTFSL